MGIGSDEEVLTLVDEIISSSAATSRRLMDRLTVLGFIPKGQIPTLIFATFLFIHHYAEARKDSTISESLEISKVIHSHCSHQKARFSGWEARFPG